jgi:hypothetical protein
MRIPGFALKRFMKIYLHNDYLEFSFALPAMGGAQPLKQGFERMIIGINKDPLFDMELYPNDYHLIYNNKIYPNQEVDKLFNKKSYLKRGDSYSIIVPNRLNIGLGKHKFYFGTRGIKMKVNFKMAVFSAPNPIEIPTVKTTLTGQVTHVISSEVTFDFDKERICPKCGSSIKIEHSFCKFCGLDMSDIDPIGHGDAISKTLAISALTDPDPGVRQEAVDTLGGFKDKRSLGVLTYILLHDNDENVRKEAADELGDIHHRLSEDALAQALKDPSALVRKEAIEGLKKIKEKIKHKDKDSED